jgi:hypothetical protein
MHHVERRMLSGEPFTIDELKRAFSKTDSDARVIEQKVREFHRLGYIRPERQQLRIRWIGTPAGTARRRKNPR